MISRTSRYALRALVGLAGVPPERHTLGRDLAERVQVPGNYLSKILLTLKKAGLVEAVRGAGGGYRLKRSPREMALLDVVALFEKTEEPGRCLLDDGVVCSEDNPCPAHAVWGEINETFFRFLKTTRLSDLSEQGWQGSSKPR